MIVEAVDHVGVAFSQVGQQEAEHGAVTGQRCQVDGTAAIFVQQTGVDPRPQEHLHHLRLAGDHGEVQRRLHAQEVTQSGTVGCTFVRFMALMSLESTIQRNEAPWH